MVDALPAGLPDGVRKLPLSRIEDSRGSLTEVYRAEWLAAKLPAVQWNACRSRPGTLRGFHVHANHHDLLTVLAGRLHLGLQDMRPWSRTYGMAAVTVIDAEEPQLVYIPPGVGHGFWFTGEAAHLYGVTRYWDPADELSCRWDDPDVAVPWPFAEPSYLSDKDRAAGSFADMQARLLELLGPPSNDP